MSGQVTGWVLRNGPSPTMPGRAGKPYGATARAMRAVLLTIADAANRDGEHAHPGLPAMVEGSLYSRSRVAAIAAQLVEEGWVEITEPGGGRGLATVYRVCIERETVQPADPSAGVNRPASAQEPSSSELETVQSGRSAPLTPTDATVMSNAGDWEPPAVVAASGFLQAASELAALLEANLAERGYSVAGKGSSKRWVLDMEALLRIDDRDPRHVRVVLGWLHAGGDDVASFWRSVVLSPANLRAKWVRMAEQYTRQVKKARQTRQPLSDDARRLLGEQYAANGGSSGDPRASAGRGLPSGGRGRR